GWASCPPVIASCDRELSKRSFRQDAETGGQDAHPTRESPQFGARFLAQMRHGLVRRFSVRVSAQMKTRPRARARFALLVLVCLTSSCSRKPPPAPPAPEVLVTTV